MPSPTDGSHRAGRWGGPPSTYAVWSRCRISGPSAPVRPAVRLRSTQTLSIRRLRALGTCVRWFPGHWPPGIGVRTSQGPRHLSPLQAPSGCQGLRHLRSPLAVGLGPWGVLGRAYQGPRHLRPLPLPPCLEAWGEACQGPRHLRYPPLTQFPGGRPPPCPTERPRSRRCPRRGRWRPRSPVLRRAPQPSTCSAR